MALAIVLKTAVKILQSFCFRKNRKRETENSRIRKSEEGIHCNNKRTKLIKLSRLVAKKTGKKRRKITEYNSHKDAFKNVFINKQTKNRCTSLVQCSRAAQPSRHRSRQHIQFALLLACPLALQGHVCIALSICMLRLPHRPHLP